MNNDLISRQAAIEAMRTCYNTELKEYDNGDEFINYNQAVSELESLPPASGYGWIPCSDRMPPMDIAVLISFSGTTPADNHPGRTYVHAMDLATWDGPEEGWFIWSMNSEEDMNAITVEAWMELPPMYQPEEAKA